MGASGRPELVLAFLRVRDYDSVVTNPKTPHEFYAKIHEHTALALDHVNKATTMLRQCEALSLSPGAPSTTIRTIRGGGASLDVWARWLANHQPATRQAIWDATGVKLTERATPHTVLCDDSIGDLADNTFLPDTVCRMRGRSAPGTGRGGRPVIYFLWDQRYDVRPLFGVGPERPMDPSDSELQTLLGVVMPPPMYGNLTDDTMDAWLAEGAPVMPPDEFTHIVDENGWDQGVLSLDESHSNEIPGCTDCGGTNHSAGNVNYCPTAQAEAVARTRAAQQATIEQLAMIEEED